VPRHIRLDAPGVVHHVMIRGVDGTRIFLDTHDRQSFVDRMTRVLVEGGAPCFAWALMPNHAHAVVRSDAGNLSRLMRRLNTGHALRFNRRWNRRGYLFQGRFRSRLVENDADLMGLVRYVNANPLEAGLVASLDALAFYPWSGHAALVGTRSPLPFETIADTLSLFDADPDRARQRLLEWMALRGGQEPALAPPGAAPRAPLHVKPASLLADACDRAGLEELLCAVCAHYRLTPEQLRSRRRQQEIIRARAVLCYWGAVRLGLMGRSLAAVLSVTPAAVSAALERGRRFALEDGFGGAPSRG
jgi:REP element-mobilizing transposase RayT